MVDHALTCHSFLSSPFTANSIVRCTSRTSPNSKISGSIGRIISSESVYPRPSSLEPVPPAKGAVDRDRIEAEMMMYGAKSGLHWFAVAL